MALPQLDYSQIDYSVDLNPLAEKYGVARDDLAEERDKYWKAKEGEFRAANPGAHVAEDSLGAIAQMQGKAPLNANDAQGNNTSTPAGAWNAQGGQGGQGATPAAGQTPNLPVTGSPAGAQTPAQQRSALYDQLLARISQPITPDANDPTIRRQADAYSAAATRGTRDMLANLAEQGGPYANLTGETRLANERAAQASGGFEAQLIGREQDARRESIQKDLALYGNLLSDDERTQLAEELGLLGAQNEAQGISNNYALGVMGNQTTRRGQDFNYDQYLRELALREWDYGNQDYYRRSGI